MSAGLAYAFVYHQCTSGLDDDARLEVDAILGDSIADAALQGRRRDAFAALGAEVG